MKRKVSLILLVLVLVISLCACGQSNSRSADEAVPTEEYAANGSFGAYSGAAADSMESVRSGAPNSKLKAAETENGVMIPAPMPEKIIYTANLSMETTQFDETVAAFEKSVVEYGGYTMYSDISGDTTYDTDGTARVINRYASYTVSIPAEKLDDFLTQTSALGNLISNNKSAENVTTRYADYETRKNSLQTEETRLLELLAKADSVDSLIALESRLSEVRYEIESLQSNLNDLDRRLAYSTVNLFLNEVRGYSGTASVTSSFGKRMGIAFANGWKNFVDGMEAVAVGMAEAIIPLLFLAVIVIVIVVVVRKRRAVRRAEKGAEKTAEEKKSDPET